MAEGRSNAAIANALGRQRGRGREARRQHLRQARSPGLREGPPAGAGRAPLPGVLSLRNAYPPGLMGRHGPGSVRTIAPPGKKGGDEGDPWGIRRAGRLLRSGLVLGAGGVVGQAYQAGVLLGPPARDGLGPAAGRHHRRHLRRLRHRRGIARRRARHGPGGLALRGAHVTPGRRHPAPDPPRRRRAAPDAVGRLAAAALEPPVPCAHHAGRPAPPGLPARRGGHDAPAPGPDRHLRAGPGPRRAHGQSLARGAADLHGPTLGRGSGRLRPGRRPAGTPGRRRPGVVRHPRLLPARRHRRHRVRRRRRALGHER